MFWLELLTMLGSLSIELDAGEQRIPTRRPFATTLKGPVDALTTPGRPAGFSRLWGPVSLSWFLHGCVIALGIQAATVLSVRGAPVHLWQLLV